MEACGGRRIETEKGVLGLDLYIWESPLRGCRSEMLGLLGPGSGLFLSGGCGEELERGLRIECRCLTGDEDKVGQERHAVL